MFRRMICSFVKLVENNTIFYIFYEISKMPHHFSECYSFQIQKMLLKIEHKIVKL